MTEHSHKGVREDLAKKRRDYLRTKARVLIPAFIVGSLSILLVGFMLKLAMQPNTMSNSQFAAFVLLLTLTVPCTVVLISCEKKALSIPYVPPVVDQIAVLPVEEVLLRGSDQPTAAPDELLRAVRGAQTDSQDLLRPHQE